MASETRTGRKSRVPKYSFSDSLAEQEAELQSNQMMARFAESRSRGNSVGVSLRSQGRAAVLGSLDAWQMANIYE